MGVAGNAFRECHGDANFILQEGASYQSIPGHPRWGFAPIAMAWPRPRRGRRSLSQNDALTAWAIIGFDNLSLVASESVCCGVLEGGRSWPADLAGDCHARFAN